MMVRAGAFEWDVMTGSLLVVLMVVDSLALRFLADDHSVSPSAPSFGHTTHRKLGVAQASYVRFWDPGRDWAS